MARLISENEILTKLADDLVAAIENAAWDYNLKTPTAHMKTAVDNYKNYITPPCSECGQRKVR